MRLQRSSRGGNELSPTRLLTPSVESLGTSATCSKVRRSANSGPNCHDNWIHRFQCNAARASAFISAIWSTVVFSTFAPFQDVVQFAENPEKASAGAASDACGGLTGVCLGNISVEAIWGLSSDCVEGLSALLVASLSANQVSAMSPSAFTGFTSSNVVKLGEGTRRRYEGGRHPGAGVPRL